MASSAYKTLYLPASELREGGRVLSCTLVHMRDGAGGIVCAEGLTYRTVASAGTSALFGGRGQVYGYTASNKTIVAIGGTDSYTQVTAAPERLFWAEDSEGDVFLYEVGTLVSAVFGGEDGRVDLGMMTDCAFAVYRERIYAPKGRTVHFSALFDFTGEGWATAAEQGPSDFTVSACGGDIVDALPAHGVLCLLREHGITCLTAYADVYNFRLQDLPYACGDIVPKSGVVCCGDLYFFTSEGLCVFDGTSAARAKNACDEEIDLAQPVFMSVSGNTVYAGVTRRDGSSAIYAYDHAAARGRYLLYPYALFARGEGAYLMQADSGVYALQGAGLPEGGACSASFTLSLADLGAYNKRLEAFTLEGEGDFLLRITGNGGTMSVQGQAGKRILLPQTVCGETLTVSLTSPSAAFRIGAIALDVRREDRI